MTKKLFQVELADALQRIGIGIAFLFAFGLSAAEATSDISVSYNFYEDWGSGACAEAWVTNHDSFRVDWEANLDLGYPISHHWNSERLDSNEPTGGIDDHTSRFMGAYWNRSLEAGTSTSFGFCIDRTEGPTHNPWDNPAMPMTNLDLHDHADHLPGDSDFIDLATYGLSHGSDHTGPDGLVGGRTAITTEALLAYNRLRAFVGLEAATLDEIGAWAFANNLTNNTQAWGNDQVGVGLWYAMQGAKVGWMADDRFDPQGVADITRTARLGWTEEVLTMVFEYGHEGFADFLIEHGFEEAFINTLKMEPHYAGWMHDRTHGWLSIEGVAIAHDVNHLTVLSHDQMQPFMNDTWDWPQWPALDVSDSGVIEYFQSMVSLGDPVGFNLE